MKRSFSRRCGHAPGALSSENREAVDKFTVLLAACRHPEPWAGHGDIAVRLTPDAHGLERGRPAEEQRPDADPVVLVLLHPDTEHLLTDPLPCARARIHGAWTTPCRLLTYTHAGCDLPAGLDLTV
ncbi:hypothetical protein [Streptomyces sp. NPDC057325]|uniref:hypothetical protein n=1 Tax=unclassified Streptomyces TaxID=2593676 RepID=UPI003645D121